MTLTEFLLARIAEDEETARAADGTRWLHSDKVVSFEAFGPDGDWVDASSPIRVDTRDNGWHIVNWSPARVLAECETKRVWVSEYERWSAAPGPQAPIIWAAMRGPMHHLATIYADHPDYDESWRP